MNCCARQQEGASRTNMHRTQAGGCRSRLRRNSSRLESQARRPAMAACSWYCLGHAGVRASLSCRWSPPSAVLPVAAPRHMQLLALSRQPKDPTFVLVRTPSERWKSDHAHNKRQFADWRRSLFCFRRLLSRFGVIHVAGICCGASVSRTKMRAAEQVNRRARPRRPWV